MRLAVLLSTVLSVASSARILAMLPFPGKSHYIFHSSILQTLVRRGHQVVEYGPYPPKEPLPNYTHVEVHTNFESAFKTWKFEDYLQILHESPYFGQKTAGFWDILHDVCSDTFKHENIQRLLQSREKFDLVFTASTFGQESMLVFGHKFNAPTITLQGFAYSSILNNPAGNVLSIATIPDTMSFLFTSQMTFIERLRNFVSVTLSLFKYYNINLHKHDALVKRYYKSHEVPSVADMVNNVSLTFINSHPAIEYPIPYTPNIVPIAGVSVVPDGKPLPQDIKRFMDEAKDGVIYFSMGTNIPMHVFPKEILQTFVNVFKKIPQRVLWKIEVEHLVGLTDNVKLAKWVPQLNVLGHSNCRLFITHGGLFSQQEAIYAGVPTVGIPFFADQPYNIKFNELRGIGIGLDLKTLSEDIVYNAIKNILSDTKFKENSQRLSKIFRDRPVSPASSLVFWVEHVLKHAGAHHLKPASIQLTWYQLALLDVSMAILLPVMLFLILVYLIIKKLLVFLCGKNYKTNVPKVKRN